MNTMLHTLKRLLFAIFSLTILTVVAAAQNTETLTVDSPITGEITGETYEQFYTFEATAGDTIIITMNAAEDGPTRLDSYLFLQNANGDVITQDDDSGGNLNSRIGPFTIPEDGTYTVVATRFQQQVGSSTGEYTLTLTAAEQTLINLGETITGTLSDEEPNDFYSFVSEEEATYELEVEWLSGEGNLGLDVRGMMGEYVGGIGADPFSTRNFTLVRLSAGQQVNFVAVRYVDPNNTSEQSSLEYSFTLTPIETQPLTFDGQSATLTGEISRDNTVDYYAFDAEVGAEISVTLNGQAEGDFAVDVYAPEGYSLFHGDTYYLNNGGPSGSALIAPTVIRTAGSYLIAVNNNNLPPEARSDESVAYDLTLTLSNVTALESGVAVEGTLEPQSNFYQRGYTYTGNAGESITVTLNALTQGSPVGFSIELAPQDVTSIEYRGFNASFNSSEASDVSYTVTLPYDATYLIFVNYAGYSPTPASADYRLMIESNGQ